MTEAVQLLSVGDAEAGDPSIPPPPDHPVHPRHRHPLPQFPCSHAGAARGHRPLSSATAVNGSLFVTRPPAVPLSPPTPSSSSSSSSLPSPPAQSQAFMAPEAPVTPRLLAGHRAAREGGGR